MLDAVFRAIHGKVILAVRLLLSEEDVGVPCSGNVYARVNKS